MRAYSHQGHGPRAEQQAGYISATSDRTPSVAKGSRFSNRSSAVKTSFTSPARVMVLFAVSASCRNIWFGPEHRHCKVHNGLTLTRAHRPAAQLPTPSPWGRLFADLTSFDELCRSGLRCPTERLTRSPDTVQDHRQLARQGHSCLARTGASLDRLGPILQV